MTQALASAKADWLNRFDGAVARKEITFGSPTVRHLYKRAFDQMGRNCHFITVFGRILLGEDLIAPAEASIYQRIQEVGTAFQRKVSAMQAVMTEAGIEEMAEFNQQETIKVALIVPSQRKFLDVLVLADEYLRLVNTLWLEGEVSDKEKSKAELELKQLLRGIGSTTRKMRIYLQTKVSEAQAKEKQSAEVKGALADAGGEGDSDASDESEPEPTASDVAAEAVEKPAAKAAGKGKSKKTDTPEAAADAEAALAAAA